MCYVELGLTKMTFSHMVRNYISICTGFKEKKFKKLITAGEGGGRKLRNFLIFSQALILRMVPWIIFIGYIISQSLRKASK